jgi:DNA repair protein RadC
MSYESIKKWPLGERPRERLLKYGAHHLSDAQILAILLRTGSGGKSALDLAMELLNTFGGLQSIEQAAPKEFIQCKGIGNAKIAQIKAAFEIGRRLRNEPRLKGPVFSSGYDVYLHYHMQLRDLKKEVFHCALLDAKNRLCKDYRVSEGTLTHSLIHPREAFREAIKESAASVIFVHNHPSGDPTPSREDTLMTQKLADAGKIIGIKVLDHVIIGYENYISMMERGFLSN